MTTNDKISLIASMADTTNPHSVIGGRILVYAVNYAEANGCAIDSADCVRFAVDKVLGVGTYEAMCAEVTNARAA